MIYNNKDFTQIKDVLERDCFAIYINNVEEAIQFNSLYTKNKSLTEMPEERGLFIFNKS